MKFIETDLKGAFIIEPDVYIDNRGFFMETYNRRVFKDHGLDIEFVQDNHSLSEKKGVIRGLHFQYPPYDQAKLVRVVSGSVLDVIVDMRRSSPTRGKWFSVKLSSDNKKILFVPSGFAHGFCTLEDNSVVLYKVDKFYNPGAEAGIRWDDGDVGIQWPVIVPVMSEKDRTLPTIKEIGFVFP